MLKIVKLGFYIMGMELLLWNFRFDTVTFVRTKESASRQNEMQQKTGLVEAIILEEPRWLFTWKDVSFDDILWFHVFSFPCTWSSLVSKVCSVLEGYYTIALPHYSCNCFWNV